MRVNLHRDSSGKGATLGLRSRGARKTRRLMTPTLHIRHQSAHLWKISSASRVFATVTCCAITTSMIQPMFTCLSAHSPHTDRRRRPLRLRHPAVRRSVPDPRPRAKTRSLPPNPLCLAQAGLEPRILGSTRRARSGPIMIADTPRVSPSMLLHRKSTSMK